MGSNKLVEIAFYVSLIVIITLALTFSILFALYSVYKRKCIKYGHEDEKILSELLKKYRHKEDSRDDFSSSSDTKSENISNESTESDSLVARLEKDKKKSKVKSIISMAVSGLIVTAILVLGGFVISYKVNNDAFFFGNTSYMVIMTGSMEEAYEGNTYLKDKGLENQITQYSMIGVEKVNPEEVALYDVLAFKNTKGETIVHRLIRIDSTEDGYRYTFRGDANSGSASYETALKFDSILGRYNGFQNYGLGVAITYFKSTAGIIALSSTAVFLVAYEVSEELIDKEYKERNQIVAEAYDSGK